MGGLPGRHPGRERSGRDPPGGAHVPRQRLGAVPGGGHGRVQAGVPGCRPFSSGDHQPDPRRGGDPGRRRADHLDGRPPAARRPAPPAADHRLRRVRGPEGPVGGLPGRGRAADPPGVGHDRDQPPRHGGPGPPGTPGAGGDRRRTWRTSGPRPGIPVPLVELRIAEPDTGERAALGRPGRAAKSRCEARGSPGSYYNDERGAASFTADGWLRTGDVAAVSPDGYVRLVDRTKDLIKSGGEWISSVELENHLMAHPDVAEAAVIAVPSERWMERPMACVVLKPGASLDPRRRDRVAHAAGRQVVAARRGRVHRRGAEDVGRQVFQEGTPRPLWRPPGPLTGDEVSTEVGPNSVSASATVDAPPEAVFDYLRRPANHAEINGDHTVQGATSGPDRLSLGDSFGMKMRMGVPYWMRSKVVEFEPNRQIAWCHLGRAPLALGGRAGRGGEVARHRDVRPVDGALSAGAAGVGLSEGSHQERGGIGRERGHPLQGQMPSPALTGTARAPQLVALAEVASRRRGSSDWRASTVVVIGGGVAGLGVALGLGRAGWPVVVLDRDELSPADRPDDGLRSGPTGCAAGPPHPRACWPG